MFRKKVMPPGVAPAWERFQEQAARVEAARSALVSCLPAGRSERVPVVVGLDLLDDELAAVAQEIDAWRRPEVDARWRECAASLGIAHEQVVAARAVVGRTDEGHHLLVAVRNCVTPLDAWHDAERAWLALRVRAG